MNASFEKLFGKLVRRWKRYQDTPRRPEDVVDLATARAELDETRSEIAEVRDRLYPPKADPRGERPFKKHDSDYICTPNPSSGGG